MLYVILIRGINVGGKNSVPMARLKTCLERMGFDDVLTYIQSGNVILRSGLEAQAVARSIENMLVREFELDSPLIKVLALTHAQLHAVVDGRPAGFGDKPDEYHSDAIFLMDIDADQAMTVFDPRPGVDTVWPGNGVVYSQRLSAERTRSRLNKIVGTVPYQSMTIRNWNTTTKLLALMDTLAAVTPESGK